MASKRTTLLRICCKNFHTNSILRNSNQIWKPPDYLVTYRKASEDYLKNKYDNAMNFYQEFTGLRELREAQYRVLVATEMLKEAQERRRESKLPLAEAQKKLQDMQHELRNTLREDDRYIMLIRDEHELMKSLKILQQNLQEAENDERDSFDRFGASLRSSHEAERVQAEKTKYFSIIASIIGTLIGVIGSSINNRSRMKELKNLVISSDNEKKQSTIEIKESLENLAERIDRSSDTNPQQPALVHFQIQEESSLYLEYLCCSILVGLVLSKLL